MAMIQCPECGQEISDKASRCPKCGFPIQKYLSSKTEENQEKRGNDASVETESATDIQQVPTKKKGKKKLVIALVVVCIVIVVVLGFVFSSSKLTVEDITISKWRLTDSTDYGDYYEGIITSEQKKPFIAVIGQYEDEESAPNFVYVEDGKGVIETYEDTDEDPSIKYRAIGYMSGKSVELSDIKVKYTDSNYYDWSYSDLTNCDVMIDINLNNSKTGLFVFDVVNETNNETDRNMIAVVVNGKAEYSYYAELPYKARGIDVSIVPKQFCESDVITQQDYVIEKAYTAEKYEGTYLSSYSGEETLAFANHADGFVLYTRELKEGGSKEKRNVVSNLHVFLHDGECTLTTYDSVSEGETILMPKYEFNIVGYITWILLEKETV